MQQFSKFENTPRDNASPFEGLRHYASEADAVVLENSNDSVHMLYAEKLERQAQLFLNGFKGHSLYAIKANPHPAILKKLWDLGVRKYEMASLREIEYVSDLLPDAELYFMHPVKSRLAIQKAYEHGVKNFAFDSVEELRKIEVETGHAEDLRLFLRISVEQTSAAHPLSGKFGATMTEAPLLLQRASQTTEKLGITFHVGSQCMDPKDYQHALETVAKMLDRTKISIDQLDIGGGFPVNYPEMKPADLNEYFDTIHDTLDALGISDLDLLCEPGRALVAEAGAVAVRVEMRKGQVLYLNDGTYGTLFDAGVPGWSYPLDTLKKTGELGTGRKSKFKLFGPTCDSLDVMEGPFELDDTIGEGDWILFRNLGAYGYAMQTRFNGFYSQTTVSIGEQSE